MKGYSEEFEMDLINFVNTKSRWNLLQNIQLVPVRQTVVFLHVGQTVVFLHVALTVVFLQVGQTVVFLNVGDVLANKPRRKSGEKL